MVCGMQYCVYRGGYAGDYPYVHGVNGVTGVTETSQEKSGVYGAKVVLSDSVTVVTLI